METQNAARSLASLIGKVAIIVVASEAAADPRRTLPMLTAVHGRMSETVAAGMGERDWSAMAEYTIESGEAQ
ncbi:hypothetical protein [Paraburkholderia sp. EG304]|uniref:hypothetical protein n=1 Tax=Paraburkholderia sp. EG304 TaxID=3237015 RepID=UPI003979E7C2